MGRRIGARLAERVWFYTTQAGKPVRTDMIQEYLRVTYNTSHTLNTMTQQLLNCGLFRRVGWFDRTNDEYTWTTKSSKQLGLHSSKWVCVIEPKYLEEIIEPYVHNKNTLRVLDKMPHFVRKAVAEARSDL